MSHFFAHFHPLYPKPGQTKVFRKDLCTINLITYDPLALSKAPGMSNDHLLRKRKQNHFGSVLVYSDPGFGKRELSIKSNI